MNRQTIDWAEIELLFSEHTIWLGEPELAWFKKAWCGLEREGLAAYSNDEERHWVYIRALTLVVMYGEYCSLEWGESFDAESVISEFAWEDWQEEISQVRIGNMVARHFEAEDGSPQDLLFLAVWDLVSKVRSEVYGAICKEFGDPTTLYAGLYASRDDGYDQENLDAVVTEIFSPSDYPLGSERAYYYVCSGMVGVDA